MGFPDDFKLIGSKGKLYNRVGNSIVIPMVEEIAKQVKKQLFNIDYTLKYPLKPKQMSLLDLGLLCS
jgi:DNA (cytosine-5)-methyltransferase 1